MITTDGKNILGKFLVGQAPAYASYIAIGTGLNPRSYSAVVTNKSLSGTTITLTTSSNHNFIAGDKIAVSGLGPLFDGVKTVASVGSTAILISTTAIPATTDIVHSTPSSGFATATTATPHGLSVGDIITIAGTTEFDNVDIPVVAVTENTFTFADSSTTNGADVVGTITVDFPDSGIVNIDFSAKSNLDFEIFRVPITSRSYFVENGISKVVFGAELPTQDRFYFTEAGIYSSGTNPVATNSDSRILYKFSSEELWERHETTSPYTFSIANSGLTAGAGGVISSTSIPVYLNNTDPIFENIQRSRYKEQPRFLESSLAIPGGYSTLNTTGDKWTYATTQHIHLTNQSLTLDSNSPSDAMVLAFSVLKRDPAASNPDVDILVEFSGDETEASTGEYAQFQIEIKAADYSASGGYFYFVKSSTIGDMNKSETFSWSNVKIVKVFVQASNDDATIVAIDGLRFENNFDNIANPLYGMVAYSPIYSVVSTDYLPVLKEENSKNLVEINFDIELGDGGS